MLQFEAEFFKHVGISPVLLEEIRKMIEVLLDQLSHDESRARPGPSRGTPAATDEAVGHRTETSRGDWVRMHRRGLQPGRAP